MKIKDYNKEVEELEYNLFEHPESNEYFVKKAKELKKEIEKGCGKEENVGNFGKFMCGRNNFLCPKCQNLIKELNKIIGSEELLSQLGEKQ